MTEFELDTKLESDKADYLSKRLKLRSKDICNLFEILKGDVNRLIILCQVINRHGFATPENLFEVDLIEKYEIESQKYI
jgi:hypothetical protein